MTEKMRLKGKRHSHLFPKLILFFLIKKVYTVTGFVEVWFSLSETFAFFVSSLSSYYSPVLSELQSRVSFSARSPGLGPCFIQVAMVKWSVRF